MTRTWPCGWIGERCVRLHCRETAPCDGYQRPDIFTNRTQFGFRDIGRLEPALDSVAIKRLIEEVRNEGDVPRAYNRVYNRHNR